MSAIKLLGKPVAQEIENQVKKEIEQRLQNKHNPPKLAVILVGDDDASHVYVKNKAKACARVGIESATHHLQSDITQEELIDFIESLNHDDSTHGILVQLPLPQHISTDTVIESISINKDVDGFHPYNIGRLALRTPHLRPCTPLGITKMLKYYEIQAKHKRVTIIGASNIVGRPLGLEMLLLGATVTVCHRHTKSLKPHVESAEILVSATGAADIFDTDWLSEDACVIDVGIHRDAQGHLRGDIDFDKAEKKVKYITPVPGGVGPLTIATLLENTLLAQKLSQ